jgi:hypothetical protein
MTYKEANEIVRQLIADDGRGFEWGIYKRFRYDVSEDAKHLAVRLLDDPNNVISNPDVPGENISIAEALRRAIGTELHCNVHRDYVYRVLALVLDDDSMGNHITLSNLLAVRNYRMKKLVFDV